MSREGHSSSDSAPIRISSPERTLEMSSGDAILASAQAWQDPALAHYIFKERVGGVLAGSVPYRAMQSDIPLFHASSPRWTPRSEALASLAEAADPLPSIRALRESPSREQFLQIVGQAVAHIEAGHLEKVVLSRSHHLKLSCPVNSTWLFSRLLAKHSRGYVFELPYRAHAGQGVLVGASPELLLSRYGLTVRSLPLAGSLPRSRDPLENERRAKTLLCSRKDLHEHRLVVSHIESKLRGLCDELVIPSSPSVVTTPTMLHLGTRIEGRLKSSKKDTHALAIALRLHPTPALCGVPIDKAEALIDAAEPEDREFYGGTVGWMNADGDGEWAVTIRCAHIEEHAIRLQAGVGIVRGSSPELELLETDAKLQTMLRALGLSRVSIPHNQPSPELRA